VPVLSGQILHTGKNFVIDRIQTAGAGDINLNAEKIYELGNYKTVATVFGTPDTSFTLESLDMSCEIEALFLNQDPTTITNHQEFDFLDSVPLDIISPYKSRKNQYDIVKGVVTPYLTLERLQYSFSTTANASISATLRGDAIYYTPGTPYYEEFTNTGPGTYSFAHTATVYDDGANDNYALSVCLRDSDSNAYQRLFLGDDYTNTSTGVTLTGDDLSATYDTVCVTYGSTVSANYPQSVHQGVSIKPAAVKGRNIDVYIGTSAATPVFTRLRGVQSAQVTRSVTLTNDEELGNPHYTSSDYDVADVTGSLTVRPLNVTSMFDQIASLAGVSNTEVVGPLSSQPLPMRIEVSSPDTGAVIKTIYISDARLTVPGTQGRANQRLDLTLSFSSDEGNFIVVNGTMA
jgi:hypothetical protein